MLSVKVSAILSRGRWDKELPPCPFTHILPGGRLNKKDGLTRYGDSHVKDKTS